MPLGPQSGTAAQPTNSPESPPFEGAPLELLDEELLELDDELLEDELLELDEELLDEELLEDELLELDEELLDEELALAGFSEPPQAASMVLNIRAGK